MDTPALATPRRGRPAQPAISAGVQARPVPVEISRASMGETVSPTPRSSEVASRNTNSPGMPSSTMREYSVACSMMSGGVPSNRISGSVNSPPNRATMAPNSSPMHMAVPAMARSLSCMRAP